VQAGPNVSLTISKKRNYLIFADTVRVTGVIAITYESSTIAIELQQPQSGRAQPQIAIAILDHAAYAGICIR